MAAAPDRAAPLSHHDLCFGCGQANLFGLQLEARPEGDGVVGRFFLKQDHQGPPGTAHGGVLATALDETMSFAASGAAEGAPVMTAGMEVDYLEPAPIGTFVRIEARVESREEGSVRTAATARTVGERAREVARARGTFAEVAGGGGPGSVLGRTERGS